MLIEIRRWYNNQVIYSLDVEGNSVRVTLEKGVSEGVDFPNAELRRANLSGANLSDADLSCANLSDADLSGANLSGANLSGANLSGANLRCADLSGANLRCADLSDADLSGANLRCADLSDADLRFANLPKADIVINDRYHIHIRPDYIKIGCEKHPPSWFKKLTFKAADRIDSAGDWWKQWKPVVLAIYDTIKDRTL